MPDLFSDLTPPPDAAGPYARPGVPVRPLAARGDPATSHSAAAEAVASGRVERHCATVLALVRETPGLTSLELHAHQRTDLDRHEIARRLADLKNAGRVIQGDQRACTVGGRQSVTWWPVGGD